jgi:hypothetical protein
MGVSVQQRAITAHQIEHLDLAADVVAVVEVVALTALVGDVEAQGVQQLVQARFEMASARFPWAPWPGVANRFRFHDAVVVNATLLALIDKILFAISLNG